MQNEGCSPKPDAGAATGGCEGCLTVLLLHQELQGEYSNSPSLDVFLFFDIVDF